MSMDLPSQLGKAGEPPCPLNLFCKLLKQNGVLGPCCPNPAENGAARNANTHAWLTILVFCLLLFICWLYYVKKANIQDCGREELIEPGI